MSVETALATDPIRIFVALLNEGTNVVRPTTGVFVGRDIPRVEPADDYDADAEEWEFPPGSEVRCVAEQWDGGQILVARSRALEPSLNH